MICPLVADLWRTLHQGHRAEGPCRTMKGNGSFLAKSLVTVAAGGLFAGMAVALDDAAADERLAAETWKRDLPAHGADYLGTCPYEPCELKFESGFADAVTGFCGRVAGLYERIDAKNAVSADVCRTLSLRAWRNERVHAQVVVWSGVAQTGVRLETSDLVGPSGTVISKRHVRGRFVRYVLGSNRSYGHHESYRTFADCLDDAERLPLPARSFRPLWYTVSVPKDAGPGTYRGTFSVLADGGVRQEFSVELTVVDRALPDARDRKFFLDLWQHPLGVARYHGVKPFSPEHYRILKPLYRELAAAGQKVITATITDYPWGGGTYGGDDSFNPIRGMVRLWRRADGTYRADFGVFDEYVRFCRSCGIGPQIHCYTIVKFAKRDVYQYWDEPTGDLVNVKLPTGSLEWRSYAIALLKLLREHLTEMDWWRDSYIAIDEADAEAVAAARAVMDEAGSDFKLATAANISPNQFADIRCEVFSQILWHNPVTGSTFLTDEFLKGVGERRRRGLVTTFYVCTEPQKPNTWLSSPPVETAWLPLYAAAKGFSGILRWACFYWPRDPVFDGSYAGCPAGETYLLYPGCRASTRWEIFRDGIENWEKIRVLRETGQASRKLEGMLKEMDFAVMETAAESSYRKQVGGIVDELDR